MKFKTAYPETRHRVARVVVGESMTRQAMANDTDINVIVAKFQRTGAIEHQGKYQGDYAEFAAVDFHEAMNIVASAGQMFESLPANIRKEFANDPGNFLSFVQNPDNEERMRDLGLLERESGNIEPKPVERAPSVPEVPEEPST